MKRVPARHGRGMRQVTVRTPDYYSARIFATLATAQVGLNPTILARCDRFVSDWGRGKRQEAG